MRRHGMLKHTEQACAQTKEMVPSSHATNAMLLDLLSNFNGLAVPAWRNVAIRGVPLKASNVSEIPFLAKARRTVTVVDSDTVCI